MVACDENGECAGFELSCDMRSCRLMKLASVGYTRETHCGWQFWWSSRMGPAALPCTPNATAPKSLSNMSASGVEPRHVGELVARSQGQRENRRRAVAVLAARGSSARALLPDRLTPDMDMASHSKQLRSHPASADPIQSS